MYWRNDELRVVQHEEFTGDFFLVSPFGSPDNGAGRVTFSSGGHGLTGKREFITNRFTGQEVLRAANQGEAYTVFRKVILTGEADTDITRMQRATDEQARLVAANAARSAIAYEALREVWLHRNNGGVETAAEMSDGSAVV